ncbi:MAG: hypothetical protein AB1486_33835 [Planctomycetota bacterium]
MELGRRHSSLLHKAIETLVAFRGRRLKHDIGGQGILVTAGIRAGSSAPEASGGEPLEGLLVREQFESFEKALLVLSERKRWALLLRLELGLDYGAIARECSYPTSNAARMVVQRSLERVAMEMADVA